MNEFGKVYRNDFFHDLVKGITLTGSIILLLFGIAVGIYLSWLWRSQWFGEFENPSSRMLDSSWSQKLRISSINGWAAYDVLIRRIKDDDGEFVGAAAQDRRAFLPKTFEGSLSIRDLDPERERPVQKIPVRFVKLERGSDQLTGRQEECFLASGKFEDKNRVLSYRSLLGLEFTLNANPRH